MSDQEVKIDPETGLKERSIDIASILRATNIPAWSKPKGVDLFTRIHEPIQYQIDQHKQ